MDALAAWVVILDGAGRILLANRAWQDHAAATDDYLAACADWDGPDHAQTTALAAGIRAVAQGAQAEFEMEYGCRNQPIPLWLQIRATRFTGDGETHVAVVHEDITALKTGERREARLANVLRGVRNVNQLITKEDDPARLVQAACANLTETLSYLSAWIVMDVPGGEPVVGASGHAAASGLLLARLRHRDWPECARRAFAEPGPGVVVIQDVTTECQVCLLGGCAGARLLARLDFAGKTFGVAAVAIPPECARDAEEMDLFAELIGDLAFALHKIDLARQARAAAEALAESERRYRTLVEDAPVGIFATTGQGKVIAANPALARMLGFASAGEAMAYYTNLGEQLYLHPERRAEFIQTLRRDGTVQNFEYEAKTADGRQAWMRMDARIAKSDKEGDFRIEGFTSDITEHKQAEEKLRESERLYRLLAENTINCIWLLGLDGTIQYLNPASRQIFGYAPEEMIGTPFDRYVPADCLPALQRAIREGVDDLPRRQPVMLETTVLCRDGSQRAVEITGRVLRNEQGQPVALQGVARDITERLRATAEIRARENLLNQIFEVLPVGLWLADGKGKLFRTNDAGRRIWGAQPLVGLEEYGAFKARRLPSRQELAPGDWALARTIREGITIRNELLEIDAFDGVRRTILNSTAPVRDAAGDIEAVVIANLDITDLQQAEAERSRLAEAIEQSQETVVITDPNAAILYVNPAFERVTGYSRAEVMGQNPHLLKSGVQSQTFYEEMWRTLQSGRTWQGRLVNRRKDGMLYTEEATISPVIGSAGEILNFVAVKRDITEHLRIHQEKEKLEEQVRLSQRLEALGRLAGGVAHDLNNLLSPILGYAELLLEDLGDQPEHRESIEEIAHAGERARELVAQLLAFGRRQLLEFAPLDLNLLLANFANLLRRTIREDIQIIFQPSPDLPPVQADAGRLEQVIMNLAVNAQDAMPEGGVLTIETAVAELDADYAAAHEAVVPGSYTMLAFSDTGVGMTPETCAHIFEPFFTTKEKGKGTGLGLATVYGIVRQHGGHIWVYSEPHQGTTFKIYLPISKAPKTADPAAGDRRGTARGTGTILLVEDNAQVRNLALAVLKRQGYTVQVATNGPEALRLIEDSGKPVDLLFTDVVMPGMSGRELYERIARRFPGLKVLYMSGYTDNVIAHQGVLDPGVNFIQKPFSVNALADKIQRILEPRQP
ncbi:MAG: PAS domain S-box protein [Lentisphaeria bacterium]|nr:PAS domain S-box protein [Lentisphaeria bacterium]